MRRIASAWRRMPVGDRGRKIVHAGAWSLIAKFSAAANLFLSVPFVLQALGPERFGAWATLVALVVFAGFLDFGIGNGVMNLVAAAHGRGAHAQVTSILREARITLLRIAAWLLLPVIALVSFAPLHRLLDMPPEMAGECRRAVAVVLGSIVLAVPLNLANRVQLGLGRGDRTFRWQALGQWLALAAIVLCAKANAGLVLLTTAAVVTPLIATAINGFDLRRRLDVGAAPRADASERKSIRDAIRIEGLGFFGLQLAAALAFSADLPLISALSGARNAGEYAIAQRLFSVIPLGLSLVWAPLWPIYRHAMAAGDMEWVARTFRRSLMAAIAFALVGAIVLAFGFDAIVALWVREPVVVSSWLVAGLALWCIVEAAGTALSTLLNAASVLRYQLLTSAVFASLCIAGKAWVITLGHVPLVPWVTVATYLLANVVGLAFFRPEILRRMRLR